jgi:hypothetical protein
MTGIGTRDHPSEMAIPYGPWAQRLHRMDLWTWESHGLDGTLLHSLIYKVQAKCYLKRVT